MTTILTFLSYLATLAVGSAGTLFVMRITEPHRFAKLLEVEDALRESAGSAIRAERQRMGDLASAYEYDEPPARTAYDAETEQWQQTADALGLPMTDYEPRREAC